MSVRPLRPHQQEAVEAALRVLAHSGRTLIVMPCGTGKTGAAAGIVRACAERHGSKRVLVVTPSLELITQTLKQWRKFLGAEGLGRVGAVCSDKDVVGHDQQEDVTTDARTLAAFNGPGRVTVAATTTACR